MGECTLHQPISLPWLVRQKMFRDNAIYGLLYVPLPYIDLKPISDEQLLGRNLENEIGRWYQGTVVLSLR